MPGLRIGNYEEALDELGIETLEERRKTLCLRFAKKCLTNEKAEKMFPLNEKKHQMDTRQTEKYKVNHAHTDRLKNFALIYMQNLLNEQEENST